MTAPPRTFAAQLRAALPILVGIGGTVLAIHAQRQGWFPDCPTIRRSLADAGAWAWLVYLVAATVTALAFVPRTVFMVTSAVGFPFWEAVALITVSSQLAAAASFLLTRGVGKRYIEALAQRKGWTQKLAAFVEANDFVFVVLMRFIHFLPFAGVNYGLGLLPISFRSYFWASLVGMLPGTILFVYLAATLGCALVDEHTVLPPPVKLKLVLSAVGLSLMGIGPLWLAARRHRRRRVPEPPTE